MINPSFKLIVAVIIICALLLYPLSAVRAIGAIMYILKEFGLDVIARIITRTILTKLSNGMVGKMLKLGRDGGPTFVRDWRQFLQKAQYRGEDILRATIADATSGVNATVCPYMRSSLARIFNAQSIPGFNSTNYRIDSLSPFKLRNRCSLSTDLNVELFRNDFNKGGWEAWGKLIQPQNNLYGVFGDSLEELSKQRGFEQGIDTSEAVSGRGNTSARASCKGEGMNKQCTIMGLIITPATVFSDAQAATINKEMDWLIGADELSEVISNLVFSVLSRLEDYAAGAVLSGEPAGDDYDASDALQRAREDCLDECMDKDCPDALPSCVDRNGDGVSDNRPCTPDDTDSSKKCNDLGRETYCQQHCSF